MALDFRFLLEDTILHYISRTECPLDNPICNSADAWYRYWVDNELTEQCIASWFVSPAISGFELAIGVAGKECAAFAEDGKKTLLRENDLEVEGLLGQPSDGSMSGIMRNVFSISWDMFFARKLLCGSIFLTDDLNLAEFGLGGNPALVELGLEGISIRIKEDTALSSDLLGIWREDRFGLLDCWMNEQCSIVASWLQA